MYDVNVVNMSYYSLSLRYGICVLCVCMDNTRENSVVLGQSKYKYKPVNGHSAFQFNMTEVYQSHELYWSSVGHLEATI